MKLAFMNFSGWNWLSAADSVIRAYTRSKWSHVGVVLRTGNYIDAFPGGVGNTRHPSRFARANQHCILDVPLPEEHAAEQFLLAQFGKPYDYTAVLGFPFRRWNDDKKWYCSELVAGALQAGGMTIPDARWISPQKLLEIVSQPQMVAHDCKVEGRMSIEAGKNCDWCGGIENVLP